MAVFKITPRIARGRLVFDIGPVSFLSFAAAYAWSAAECHRVDIAETGGAP